MRKKGKKLTGRQKGLLIGGIILLLALGIYFLFRGDDEAMRSDASSGPAIEFDNIDFHESKDGETVWQIKAAHVTMDKDRNLIHMTGVQGFFVKDGDELQLSADKGEMDRTRQTVYLEGNVDGKTKTGMTLKAENLSYDGKTQVLSTDRFFTAERDNRVLTGDSFRGDRVLNQLRVEGHAKLADKEEEK